MPKSGTVTYKATKRISAGGNDVIRVKLWEGEISDPVEYNRHIGTIKIDGNSFDSGIIPAGSTIECAYTFTDSGNIEINITVPSVGITINGDNIYDRLSGQIDYENDSQKILSEAQEVVNRINDIGENIFDEKISDTSNKLQEMLEKEDLDAEDMQALSELTQNSKSVVASFMRQNKTIVWQKDLMKTLSGLTSFQKMLLLPKLDNLTT